MSALFLLHMVAIFHSYVSFYMLRKRECCCLFGACVANTRSALVHCCLFVLAPPPPGSLKRNTLYSVPKPWVRL
jgi:hypothetical protein